MEEGRESDGRWEGGGRGRGEGKRGGRRMEGEESQLDKMRELAGI